MRCELVQRRLLGVQVPAQVPADIRAHLARCATCRDWQSNLLLLEENIPLIPVPASRGKGRLLRQLMPTQAAETKVEKTPVTALVKVPAFPVTQPATLRFSQVLLLTRRAAVLAAALLLLVLGWWLFQSRTETPESPPTRATAPADPLLASLVERDLRLATAASPRERIEILADMAQELQATTRTLVQEAASDELNGLAKLYEQVVHEGILKQAQVLPAGERRSVLNPIAARLSRTALSFERLVQRMPAPCSKPLQMIGAAAREGNRRLYGLLSEARS